MGFDFHLKFSSFIHIALLCCWILSQWNAEFELCSTTKSLHIAEITFHITQIDSFHNNRQNERSSDGESINFIRSARTARNLLGRNTIKTPSQCSSRAELKFHISIRYISSKLKVLKKFTTLFNYSALPTWRLFSYATEWSLQLPVENLSYWEFHFRLIIFPSINFQHT